MAEEALDYYRNGPSFLQHYLPFLMINYTKRLIAVLLTAFAVVIPTFTYAPRLYEWFLHAYLNKLYRRLRAVETEMDSELTAVQVEALQINLKDINRAAQILPMRHSDTFIELINTSVLRGRNWRQGWLHRENKYVSRISDCGPNAK